MMSWSPLATGGVVILVNFAHIEANSIPLTVYDKSTGFLICRQPQVTWRRRRDIITGSCLLKRGERVYDVITVALVCDHKMLNIGLPEANYRSRRPHTTHV